LLFVYVHVPKAGGTTMEKVKILEQNFSFAVVCGRFAECVGYDPQAWGKKVTSLIGKF